MLDVSAAGAFEVIPDALLVDRVLFDESAVFRDITRVDQGLSVLVDELPISFRSVPQANAMG